MPAGVDRNVKGSIDRRYFTTLAEWVDAASADETTYREGRSSRRSDSSEWYGGATWNMAVDLARRGWPEGREQVERVRARIVDRISEQVAELTAPQWVSSIVGVAAIPARVLSGRPDFMLNRLKRSIETPVVHIVLNMTVSSGISAEAIRNKGAAACALIDLLELTGRRCKVEAVLANAGGGLNIEYRVLLKDPAEPLNVDIMAFALAHPAMFRRLGFAVEEQAPPRFRENMLISPYGGYGKVVETIDSKGDIYLPPVLYGYNMQKDTEVERYVLDALAEQGVHIDNYAA